MKSIYDIVNQIKDDIETDLPDLLYNEDLSDFDVYAIGPSRKAEEIGLFVYKSELIKDARKNHLSVIVFAQLYRIGMEESTKYEDIIVDYLTQYNPTDIGMDYIDSINSDTWPLDESASTLIGIEVSFFEELDSCD